MDDHHVTARIAQPASSSIGLHLLEESPDRVIAVATNNGHLLMEHYFGRGGRVIFVRLDGTDRPARISGTVWKPQGRLWLLEFGQAAA